MTSNQSGPEPLRVIFGRRVRELRTQQGLTQQQLGRKAGMHPAYVGGIERGERNITLDGVERLARALGVSPAELLAQPATLAPAGLERQVRELALHARDASDLQLALEVARFVLDRLRQQSRLRWAAAEQPDDVDGGR